MPGGDLLARGLAWLAATPLAVGLRESTWLYPIIETVHIAGFTILVGAAVMFDLRLLGASRTVRVTALARHVLPWSRRSVPIVVTSGVLLFSTQPVELAGSPVFRLKLTLIALAGLNAWLFHAWTFKDVEAWDHAAATPVRAKMAGATSLLLWGSVLTCGRFLAYF